MLRHPTCTGKRPAVNRGHPIALHVRADSIPSELRDLGRWVCWRFVKQGNRWGKLPIDPHTGRNASCDRPATWATFAAATLHYQEADTDGIGLMLGNGLAGVDLDKCRDPQTGHLDLWAQEIIAFLSSYTDVSPSGSGIKIFLRGTLPGTGRRKSGIELYSAARYFAITGHHLDGTPTTVQDRQRELADLHARLFADITCTPPREPVVVGLADDDLIRRACAASDTFTRLWQGDATGFRSASEADWALAKMLAFWCGPDLARIDGLFRASGLMRPKWSRRAGEVTYGTLTVSRALVAQTKFYVPRTRPPHGGHQNIPPTCDGNAYHLTRISGAKSALSEALKVEGLSRLPPNKPKQKNMARKRRLLVALCRILQERAGNEPFFLGCETAGELLRVGQATANRWLRQMVRTGALMLVKAGDRRKRFASEWRFLQNNTGGTEK